MADSPEKLDLRSMDIAAEKRRQFICLDQALGGNDALKVNAIETFRAAEPEIQFRTV